MQKRISKISFIFGCALIVFIPFQAFFLELFNSTFGWSNSVSFWLVHWYEPIIIFFSLAGIVSLIRTKTKLWLWQKSVISLILLGVVSVFLFSATISRGTEGFRLTLFMLLTLFCAFNEENYFAKLVSLYLKMALVLAIWAIIERFLPPGYWQNIFKFSTNFGFGHFLVGSVARSASLLGGPNQLGTYLLPAVFIIGLKFSTKKQISWIWYVAFGIIVLAIGFAYSRAALLGLILGLTLLVFLFIRDWPTRLKMIIFSLLMVTIPIYVANLGGNTTSTVLTHGDSQIGHESALKQTVVEIKKRIHEPIKIVFGGGLGSAGPLVLKYQNGIISESWYFQILLELGIVGLVLWVILIIDILKELYNKRQDLFIGLISVSVAALFLHTFADNPALSYSLFLLIGARLSRKAEKPGAV